MPNILAAAADPHSWCDLMGIDIETTNATAALGFYNNTLNLFAAKPAIPVVPLSANSLCINLAFVYGVMYTQTGGNANNGLSSDWRKVITIKNSAGYPIFSFGYTTSGSNADTINRLKFFIWDGTATQALLGTTALNTNIVPEVTDTNVRATNNMFNFYINIDTVTPANSVAVAYLDGLQVLNLSGAALHLAGALTFASLTIGTSYTTNPAAIGTVRMAAMIASFVALDYQDFTVYAVPYKPSAIGSVNDFTGVIANITSWLQDKLYFTTSVEVGATVEFIMAIPAVGYAYLADVASAMYAPKQIKSYLGGRYIQAGGVSITYTVTLYSGTTQISNPVSVVVNANENDDQYLVDFAGAVSTSIATSQPISQSEIAALRVRVALVGA